MSLQIKPIDQYDTALFRPAQPIDQHPVHVGVLLAQRRVGLAGRSDDVIERAQPSDPAADVGSEHRELGALVGLGRNVRFTDVPPEDYPALPPGLRPPGPGPDRS
jgi:hypothetical protein